MSYFYWFAVCLVVTYGMTGSALLAPVRQFIGARSLFFLGLIYCPICFGFWVAVVAAYFYPEASAWRFVHAPAAFTTMLLLGRLLHPTWLASETIERELDNVSEYGRQHDAEDA